MVAGASGLVGEAATLAFAARGEPVIAVSRRPPRAADGVRHVAVDLTDADAVLAAVAGLPPVTHLVYAALYEKPDLVAGWRDPDQMATNRAMLDALLTAVADRGALAHVSLMQGTKAYGVHLRPIAVPAREDAPRHAHDNFYWLQEDLLRERAAEHGFAFTIWRPQVVFGETVGVAMNLVPALGAYAAIRREEGRPFSFPGGPPYVLEATDARLLGRALAWASEAEAAANATFNITNGDVFVWHNVWPAIADALGVEPGEPERHSLASLPEKADVWERVVARHGLEPTPLPALLGASHLYADFAFATGASRPPQPALVSTVKVRQAGFHECIDTEIMLRELIAALQERRIIPPR
ncbi:NAD-dependent epimerase/dehydratase family protein [Acuticoccus sp.]|uniref:NAD-dependent epimerase/dehydratase family protein n=1 Tax=Acuticoccus sp. TaxID=1904378 RepID=UPI003B52D14A